MAGLSLWALSLCVSHSLWELFFNGYNLLEAPLYTLRVIDGGVTALKDFAVISYLLFRSNYS